MAWSAEGRDKEGRPVRDEGSVTYSAAIESAASDSAEDAPFAQRVLREATRRGFDQAERRVVLGDSAVWIWNLSHEYFPGAVNIVDRFHAKERLSGEGRLRGRERTWQTVGQRASRRARRRAPRRIDSYA